MKDYYKILGVAKQASAEELKRAYRKLAKQYHPDVVKNDKAKQERMYEIQEAYECLRDEARRKKYDEACLKASRNLTGIHRDTKGRADPGPQPRPDMSQFERFFGFQPGKGMDTYQDTTAKKPEGPVKPEEMFAAFFGNRNPRGSKK